MAGRENIDDNFEHQWQEAFDGYEHEVPPAVWSEIDRGLTHSDLSVYKSKVVYYRWIAAAVVIMAVSLVSFQYYFFQENIKYVSYVDASADWPRAQQSSRFLLPLDINSKTEARSVASQFGGSTIHPVGQGTRDGMNMLPISDQVANTGDSYQPHAIAALKATTVVETSHKDKYLYFLPIYNFQKQKKKAEDSKYFAGLNVGSGSFNPNYQASLDQTLTNNLGVRPQGFSSFSDESSSQVAPNVREDMSAGETVSMGLNFGLKLGDRWTLESGVMYARADAITKTNVVIETTTYQEVIPATNQGKNIPAFENAVAREAVVEYDYRDVNMNNQFEFTSVPLKAGYLVLDKRFSVEVNAGLIANIYLGNKLTSNDQTVADLTIGPGNTSPYRDLSFSGLAGLEFGYQFMKNFDVIVEPNYRQSINSLTKESSTFSTNPSGFGLMTGLRYNFN